MTKHRPVMSITAAGVVILSIGFILLSPLARRMVRFEGNVHVDDVAALLVSLVMVNAAFILGVISVCACCQLAKRLGYDPMLGLALLCPGVNLAVFYYIAFRESPIETALRRAQRREDQRTKHEANLH